MTTPPVHHMWSLFCYFSFSKNDCPSFHLYTSAFLLHSIVLLRLKYFVEFFFCCCCFVCIHMEEIHAHKHSLLLCVTVSSQILETVPLVAVLFRFLLVCVCVSVVQIAKLRKENHFRLPIGLPQVFVCSFCFVALPPFRPLILFSVVTSCSNVLLLLLRSTQLR